MVQRTSVLTDRSGVLIVDKPPGWTSREVVDEVEERSRGRKVGHGGTLDPLATGVLPVLVDEATKLVPYLQERPKTYRVEARLDVVSETLDAEGEVREVPVEREPSEDEVRKEANRFQGALRQVPPEFSAVKVGGERAHERARRGESVELEAKPVRCYELDLEAYDFPTLTLRITCGKGFYVRSLVRDLARELDIQGGIVTELERIRYGPFDLEQGVLPEDPESWNEAYFDPVTVVDNLPERTCTDRELELVTHGSWIDRDPERSGRAVAVDSEGGLHAILRSSEKRGTPEWRPERVLNRSITSDEEVES